MVIGVIAEEMNDVEVLEELTYKIVDRRRCSFKHFLGHGCGKLRRKCEAWSSMLVMRGCTHVVVIHDLDRNKEAELRNGLQAALTRSAAKKHAVIIPIEEMEAWLLSDIDAIRKVFNIRSSVQRFRHPETIMSPKEVLSKLVSQYSKARYLNTVHNRRIAAELDIGRLECCPSFQKYPEFLGMA